jgi:hypothetical protein
MSIVHQVLKSGGKERRSIGRTRINRNALLFFAGRTGVFSCCVRDVTNLGAGIRLEGLSVERRALIRQNINPRCGKRTTELADEAGLAYAGFAGYEADTS